MIRRRRARAAALAAFGLLLAVAAGSHAAARPPAGPPAHAAAAMLRLVPVGTFVQPLYVTAPPGDRRRVFVVEKPGRIRVIRDGHVLNVPFLDIRGLVATTQEEQGLLSLAFAPDYAKTGRFYVDYTAKDSTVRVVEYRRVTPDRADPRTARRLITLQHVKPPSNVGLDWLAHNGGLLVFGPDRLLYVGVGDGASGNRIVDPFNRGQSLNTLWGKILRIDPRPVGRRPYRIPASNPFAHRPGVLPEIYDYGLRNPWRYSFDRLTGDMVIADVGAYRFEEVNFARHGQTAGRNYGWRVFEGFQRSNYPDVAASEQAPGAVAPVFAYDSTQKNGGHGCAIIGGEVVRDPTLRGFYGRYLYGDFCVGIIRSLVIGPGFAREDTPVSVPIPGFSSFGHDAIGHLYATTLSGKVYRLASP